VSWDTFYYCGLRFSNAYLCFISGIASLLWLVFGIKQRNNFSSGCGPCRTLFLWMCFLVIEGRYCLCNLDVQRTPFIMAGHVLYHMFCFG
jgi:hypothetical protein